jgi:hypothetical protein
MLARQYHFSPVASPASSATVLKVQVTIAFPRCF